MTEPMRAAQFLGTLGVNVHMEYTDGHYVESGRVIASLAYLGITNVRDGAVWSGNQGQGAYGLLADAGIKFDMIAIPYGDLGTVAGGIEAFAAAHPGSINAIEGPNEINNWAVSYDDLSGTDAAVAYEDALVKIVDADGVLSGIDTYSLTGANVATTAAFANFHSYAWDGNQPGATLAYDLAPRTSAMAGKPVVLTETGYYTAATSGIGWAGVDEPTQAKEILNLFMDAAKLGIARTYVYQLLDPYSDPSGVEIDKHLGLFDLSFDPKQSAVAIHNLTSILADPGADAQSFGTTELDYTLSNMPATANTLTLEKSSGVTDIVLWAEPDIWDQDLHQAIVAPESDVAIDFGDRHVGVLVYDPLVSADPIASYADVTSIHVAVQDHPLIVEVSDIADRAPATAATDAPTSPSAQLVADPVPSVAQSDSVLGRVALAETASDFNGDGRTDLLWRDDDGAFTVADSTGHGFTTDDHVDPSLSSDWTIAGIGDLNGDGKSDLVVRSEAGTFAIQQFTGEGFTDGYTNDSVGTDWKIAGIGDLNGDGKDDIVWRQDGGTLTTWLSTGTGFTPNTYVDGSVSTDWKIVGLADFNGDGKADILWRNAGTGTFTEWQSTGTGFTQNTYVDGSVGTDWHIDALADFNGDGKADILWRHDGDGTFTVWQSTGAGFTPNTYVDGSVSPAWQVAQAGDFDGDGKADLLWRNADTGSIATWQSNGDAFDPNVASAAGIGASWHVAAHDYVFG